MINQTLRFYKFGPFSLNVNEHYLERDNEVVPLTPKVFETLLILVENSGHVLEKTELMDKLWPDSFVEESSLTQNISLLRKTLEEFGGERQYIETIPKRGYRFVEKVQEVRASESEATLQERSYTEVLFEDERFEFESKNISSQTEPAMPAPRRFLSRQQKPAVLAGASILMLTALTFFYISRREQTTIEGLLPKHIAVLPFKTIGAETDTDLLGLGMADAVILKLSGLEQPTVLPTGSVSKYTTRDQDAISIGKDLGVDAVLDGTLQRDGDRVRVTAQLIRLSDSKVLWSGKFENRYSSVFALQDSMSEELATALTPHITDDSKRRMVRHLTENTEAYQAYLTGVYFWNLRNKDHLAKAITYLEQAIKMDQKFAVAHAVLADCFYLKSFEGDMTSQAMRDAMTRANEETTKALELDDTLAEAHTVKAGLLLYYNDFSGSDREYRHALELNPSYAVGHIRYGYFLFGSAKLEEAMSHMKLAQSLDPVSPTSNAAYSFMLFMARDYDGAIEASKRALEIQPDLSAARVNLGEGYVMKGMFQEALAEFEKLKDTDPVQAAKEMVYTYGVSGHREEGLRILSQLQQSKDEKQIVPFEYAVLYAALGDKDKAFAWLDKTSSAPFVRVRVQIDPELDSLREDRRFNEFLQRRHIEPLRQPQKPTDSLSAQTSIFHSS